MDGAASVKLAPLRQWLLRTQISPRNSKTLHLIGRHPPPPPDAELNYELKLLFINFGFRVELGMTTYVNKNKIFYYFY
jgi:hypothetical protein